jgi:hypothetical protein
VSILASIWQHKELAQGVGNRPNARGKRQQVESPRGCSRHSVEDRRESPPPQDSKGGMIVIAYAYTTVTGKLRSLFAKISQIGQPEVADARWLSSIGFKTKNDVTMIGVLKFIKFLDPTGRPTDKWTQYRDRKRAGKVMAEAVLEAYGDLYETYPDAHQRGTAELDSYFSTKSTGGSRVITATVRTFKVLSELADFTAVSAPVPPGKASVGPLDRDTLVRAGEWSGGAPAAGVTVNINIQLTLPDTTDRAVYDNFFAALKKHLLE